MNKFLAKIVAWITAGYPEGVPGPDRVPLFALLKPRLTDDEVKTVVRELIDRGEFDHVDIAVLIISAHRRTARPRGRRTCARPPGRQGLAARRSARSRGDRIAVLRPVPVPAGPSALSVMPAVERALAGGLAMLPVPADDERQTRLLTTSLRVDDEIDDDVAVVVSTSGTTGTPKGAMLTAAALTASADATHSRLGGPGRWLLALPAHHIAGLQVLVRSVVAGPRPGGRLSPIRRIRTTRCGFGDGSRSPVRLAGGCTTRQGVGRSGRRFGTGRTGRDTDRRRPDACPHRGKGCSGRDFAGAHIRDERNGGRMRIRRRAAGRSPRPRRPDGRIALGGATLAKGYRNPPETDPFAEPGWFVTDDVGALDGSGDAAGTRQDR